MGRKRPENRNTFPANIARLLECRSLDVPRVYRVFRLPIHFATFVNRYARSRCDTAKQVGANRPNKTRFTIYIYRHYTTIRRHIAVYYARACSIHAGLMDSRTSSRYLYTRECKYTTRRYGRTNKYIYIYSFYFLVSRSLFRSSIRSLSGM